MMISLSGQCSHFMPPENTRKPELFKGYKMGTLARNELNILSHNAYYIICSSLFVWTHPLSKISCLSQITQNLGLFGTTIFYKNIEKYNQVVIRMSIDMSKLCHIEIFEINKEIAAVLSYSNMG